MSSGGTTFHHVPSVSHMPSGAESPTQGLPYPPVDGSTSPVRLLTSLERGHSAPLTTDQPTTRSQRNRSEPSFSPQWPQSVHQPTSLRYYEGNSAGLRVSDGHDQGQTFFPPERETKDEQQSSRRHSKQRLRDPEKAGSVYSENHGSYLQDRSHAHHIGDRYGGDGANYRAEKHSLWILVRVC